MSGLRCARNFFRTTGCFGCFELNATMECRLCLIEGGYDGCCLLLASSSAVKSRRHMDESIFLLTTGIRLGGRGGQIDGESLVSSSISCVMIALLGTSNWDSTDDALYDTPNSREVATAVQYERCE